MPKMARNRSALHDVLAQGASNRDITVIVKNMVLPRYDAYLKTGLTIW